MRPEILEAMLPYYKENFGNASSLHSLGRTARVAIDEAREKIAKALGCETSEIVFTGSGTEADNQAIKGVAYANKKKGDHIITSKIEHHAVLHTCQYLEKHGFRVTYLPVDEHALVDPSQVEKAINDKTILVTIMHANNEVGTIEPVEEIGKIAKAKGVYFHTDAIQTFGKLPTKVKELGVDLLSVSAHKIYGPKGVGALYVRKGTKIDALLHGGHHERNRRASTENVAGIVGLGKATELALAEMEEEKKRLINLRERLYNGIKDKIKHIIRNGHPKKCLPGTLSLCFEYVEGESIILSLDLKGIAVSSGSACTSGSLEPSHVLSAMGIPPTTAQGSIRFSLGRENTEEEIDYTIEVLVEVIACLREISPFKGK